MLLSPHEIDDILDQVYRFLGINAAYIPLEGKAVFRPFQSPIEQKQYRKIFQDLLTSEDTENGFNVVYDNIFIACRHVAALGHKMGHIFIYSSKPISDFEFLILEKTAVAVSQDLLRDLYAKEKKSIRTVIG